MGPFIRREVGATLEAASRVPANAPPGSQEEVVADRTADPWAWAKRIAA